MPKFKEGDKVVRGSARHDLQWGSACSANGYLQDVVCEVITTESGILELVFPDGKLVESDSIYSWPAECFRYATGLEVQQGVALPAEDHIAEKEAHVECLRGLLETEKQTVSRLQAEVTDLKRQLEKGEEILTQVTDARDAAVAAAKSFGEDILEMKRDARHVRYEQTAAQSAAYRVLAGLNNGLEDIDLDDLINQLRHISEICDEQGNGADAKLCGEAASALSLTRRALEDWDAI